MVATFTLVSISNIKGCFHYFLYIRSKIDASNSISTLQEIRFYSKVNDNFDLSNLEIVDTKFYIILYFNFYHNDYRYSR